MSSIPHNYFPPKTPAEAPWADRCSRPSYGKIIDYGNGDFDVSVEQRPSTVPSFERVDSEAERERSLRRAKCKLIDAVRCLRANRIVTLTSEACITDRAEFAACVRLFIRRMRLHHKEWKCVYALELQKRGAWHAHLAVTGFQYAEEASALWCAILGEERKGQYDLGGVLVGRRAAGYISKYIGKDFPEGERPRYGHHYGRSRGLTPLVDNFQIHNATYREIEDWALGIFESRGARVAEFSRSCSGAPYFTRRARFRC